MKILVNRIYLREAYTVGCMKIHDGTRWMYFCDTIEPRAIAWSDDPDIGQVGEERVAGQTAIPEGTYRIVMKENKTYKRMMPTLVAVPQFLRVVIRTGKRPEQTRGDILLGHLQRTVAYERIPSPMFGFHPSDDPTLKSSLLYFNLLVKQIEEALARGEAVWLTVRSRMDWRK